MFKVYSIRKNVCFMNACGECAWILYDSVHKESMRIICETIYAFVQSFRKRKDFLRISAGGAKTVIKGLSGVLPP